MATAALARPRKSKDLDAQMMFSFAEKRKAPNKAKEARPAQKKLTDTCAVNSIKNQLDSVTELCHMMHQLASKYVPRSAFNDFEYLVQGTKVLQELQVPLTIADNIKAPLTEYNAAVVLHAPQYRLLRNRALAALTTIADLSSKSPAKGSTDYQKGMRDGFEYASDIAIFFLEDLESVFAIRR